MTYTCATMSVSKAAFDEIKASLLAAGYDHAVSAEGLDMTHVMLTAGPDMAPAPAPQGAMMTNSDIQEPGALTSESYALAVWAPNGEQFVKVTDDAVQVNLSVARDNCQPQCVNDVTAAFARLVLHVHQQGVDAAQAQGAEPASVRVSAQAQVPVDIWQLQRAVMHISGQMLPPVPRITMGTLTYIALAMEELAEVMLAVMEVLYADDTRQQASPKDMHNMLVASATMSGRAKALLEWSLELRGDVAGRPYKRCSVPIPNLRLAKEVADGFTDLAVVVAGGCLGSGIPGAECYREVVHSNLSKANPQTGFIDLDDSGKWIKGANYQAPNLEKVLAPFYGGEPQVSSGL